MSFLVFAGMSTTAAAKSSASQNDTTYFYGSSYTVGLGLLAAFFVVAARHYISKLYQVRKQVRQFQKDGYPVAPGHSWIFGHLLYLKTYVDKLPPAAHYQYALGDMGADHFSEEGNFYIDLWPLAGIIMINFSPNVSVQVLHSGKVAVNRPSMLPRFFAPITGGPNLFDLREKEWRPWRVVFNKGFNSEHITSLVPGMVKETLMYCTILEGKAKSGDIFSLDATTLRFTMDMIGKTVLNTSLNAQQGYNTLADCMLSTIRWHQANAETNPFSHLNFVRKYIHWSNGRQMDHYIGDLLDKRHAYIRAQAADAKSDNRGKSVIDLVLQARITDYKSNASDKLDPDFRLFAIRQIRLFLFAGHDSTSSTICYIFYLLSQHPDKLQKLREEISEVYGKSKGSTEIANAILKDPSSLNGLKYTNAVIKETLRLYPPASASREGFEGETIVNDKGKTCSINGIFILTLHTAIQRNPIYWVEPNAFIPERFLASPEDKLYPPKNAWRPFEKGPRNCLAEGLVMTELKVVLAIVTVGFDFNPAYDELDRKNGKDAKKWSYQGERAYQIEEGAAHPCEGMPVRAKIRT